ncbi:MFS transporter [Micromonospora endophytica]|uniref:MFS transporter n=1 Tax=Micromonospora endophytica TaxID=515350 RepID=A0A2W2BG97_9ACTN|nr:MFS transporter [Micromonospora endophytica]PZF86215.1 MFS transporter [Micromonospora endophytica]RIW42781.1 MFS transporter [Micromonospora endophytica]BCJ62716.1 MFS transporter [Micromonospora endophytica]
MTSTSTGVRNLAATLYAYAFLTDLVLLYPVYALLFADSGLSVGQISSLFVIWSLAALALETPSGAWADATSRRQMLCLAPICAAAGFALWTFVPSYYAFALGFVLWGAGSAFASGALEALVFDELDHLGAADRYARTIGRARTAGTVGVLVSILLAGPALQVGGYLAVGVASIAACGLALAVATRFPEHRRADAAAPAAGSELGDDEPGWWQGLRRGVAEARHDRAVRAAVVLVAAVTAVWSALEEYLPLLARDTGVALSTVPLLLLLVAAGQIVGGLLAPLGQRLGTGGYALVLAGSAAALASGALLRQWTGFLLVAAAFCGFQLASVLADTRLQERISGTDRATVTSLAGLATDVTGIAVYASYGLLAGVAGNPVAFAVWAVPYLLVAALLTARARNDAPGGGPARTGRVDPARTAL